MDFFNHLLYFLENFRILGYFIVFLISIIESFAFLGALIPGTIFVVFAGVLAAKGFFDVKILIISAIAGAIIADFASYYLGKKGKRFFKHGNKFFKLSYLEQGEIFFQKHGNKSLFLGRFIGPIRAITPFVAGLSKMNFKKFIFWDIVSVVSWAVVYILLGFFFGHTWQAIEILTTRIGFFLISLVVFLLVFWFLKRIVIKQGLLFFTFLSSILVSIKYAVANNAEVRKFISKHPLFFDFLGKRLDKNKFSGLPSTIFGIVFLYVLFLFSGVVESILHADLIIEADGRVANFLAIFRQPQIVKAFLWVTLLGKWKIVVFFTAITSVIFWLWEKRTYIFPLWLTVVGAGVMGIFEKMIFHRVRPSVAVYVEDSFSFPSGHAIMAIAFYGFLIYFFWRNISVWKRKVNILFFGLLVIIAIGFSRLYLGVHYLSDVWGGFLFGSLWLIIGMVVSEWLLLNKQEALFAPASRIKLISGSLAVLGLVFFIGYGLFEKPEFREIQAEQDEIIAKDILAIFNEKNLPRYGETLAGKAEQPLNFLIIGQNDDRVIAALKKAGWELNNPIDFISLSKVIKAKIVKEPYHDAPLKSFFWNGNIYDFGFSKTDEAKKSKHALRLWKTNIKTPEGSSAYIGSSSLILNRKLGFIYQTDPDVDTERDNLFNSLFSSASIDKYYKEAFVKPEAVKNFLGNQFFTDGKIYVIYLK